ncbi:hypothetical protein D3C73_1312240 [compost metagenome]
MVVKQIIAAHMRADGDRPGRIRYIRISVVRIGSDKLLNYCVILEILHFAFLVGGEEAVIGHNYRQPDF